MSSSAFIWLNCLMPAGQKFPPRQVMFCFVAAASCGRTDHHGRDRSRLGRQNCAFLLVWALLNFFWLALFRRPAVAALLSLEFVVALTLLSRFKFDKLWMTVDFVDLMIIDRDTSAFLLAAFPSLRGWIALAAATTALLLIAAWRLDSRRVRLRTSLAGGVLCTVALVTLSLSFPTGLDEDFISQNYVSKFARTGVEAIDEFARHGYLQADASVAQRLNASPASCDPSDKLPHIILLHDESSFDITAAPGIKVPSGYHSHFQSFDGKARKLVVEGAGGPSWFTEYNVLTGLSARSFGRFATSVTRIAAGRVNRGSAAFIASLRLQNVQPLSVLWRFSRFARLPDHSRHRALSGHARPRHP